MVRHGQSFLGALKKKHCSSLCMCLCTYAWMHVRDFAIQVYRYLMLPSFSAAGTTHRWNRWPMANTCFVQMMLCFVVVLSFSTLSFCLVLRLLFSWVCCSSCSRLSLRLHLIRKRFRKFPHSFSWIQCKNLMVVTMLDAVVCIFGEPQIHTPLNVRVLSTLLNQCC